MQPEEITTVPYNDATLKSVQPGRALGLLDFSLEAPRLLPDAIPSVELAAAAAAVQFAGPARTPLRRDDVISVSELAAWLSCPRRVLLNRQSDSAFARKPSPDPDAEVADDEAEGSNGSERALGTAAHAALEAVFSRGAKNPAEWRDIVDQAFRATLPQDEVPAALWKPARDSVARLLDSAWGRAVLALPAARRFVERPLRFRMRVDEKTGSTLTVVGKLDLIAELEPGRWVVADYKFAEGEDAESRLRYAWQARIYATVAARILQLPVEQVQAGIVFLKGGAPRLQTLADLGFDHENASGFEHVLPQLAPMLRSLDWRALPKQVWRPGDPAPLTRKRAKCHADGCPFVRRCY